MKRIFALILGILLALAGLAAIVFGLLAAYGDGERATRLLTGAVTIPFGIMLLELGIATGLLAVRAMRGDTGRMAALPPWWGSALAFAAAIVVGWLALRYEQWWLFFPCAVLAVFAPVAAAGRLGLPRGNARPGWGRLIGAFLWGALATPVLAISIQGIALVGTIVAAVVGLNLSGPRTLQTALDTWTYRLQGRSLTDDQANTILQFVARQPLVIAVGAAVLVFAGPASEELCKFGGTLLFSRTRQEPGGPAADPVATIFLIGLASGLGFAATENIFYVAQGVQGSAQGWAVGALSRAATPIMHGTASALFALGWARQARNPRGWALLWGALGALGLHAVWNLCAGLLIIASLFATARGASAPAGLLLVMALAVLGALLIASVVTLLRQRRALAQPLAVAPAGAPAVPPPAAIPPGLAPAYAAGAAPPPPPQSLPGAIGPRGVEVMQGGPPTRPTDTR